MYDAPLFSYFEACKDLSSLVSYVNLRKISLDLGIGDRDRDLWVIYVTQCIIHYYSIYTVISSISCN